MSPRAATIRVHRVSGKASATHHYRREGPGKTASAIRRFAARVAREKGRPHVQPARAVSVIRGQEGRTTTMTPDITTNHLAAVYLVYAGASLGLTIWLARTLFKN